LRQPVLDAGAYEAFLNVTGTDARAVVVLATAHPTTAVDHDDARPLLVGCRSRLVNVQHRFLVLAIWNVGFDRDRVWDGWSSILSQQGKAQSRSQRHCMKLCHVGQYIRRTTC